jgi:oligopeptide/dipeptide ABC transporter ATP-binding protein
VTEPLVSIDQLCVSFRSRGREFTVVDDLSFDIEPGVALALVGESGSGKTVTALSILSLLPGNARVAGSIRFCGQDLLRLSGRKLRAVRGGDISMIYQGGMSSLNPAFTVGDQIAETVRTHLGLSRRQSLERAADLLDRVGIPGARKRVNDYPYMFSGGMQQRVMIAMALSTDPKLLIADEPTTALDATVQAQVIELLAELRDAMSMSLLFLTHDLGSVAALCDRVVVMYAGQVVEDSPVDDLFEHPLHPYTEGLLGSISRLDRDAVPSAIPGFVPPPWALPQGCHFHPRCRYQRPELCARDVPGIRHYGPREVRCVRANELTLKGSE